MYARHESARVRPNAGGSRVPVLVAAVVVTACVTTSCTNLTATTTTAPLPSTTTAARTLTFEPIPPRSAGNDRRARSSPSLPLPTSDQPLQAKGKALPSRNGERGASDPLLGAGSTLILLRERG